MNDIKEKILNDIKESLTTISNTRNSMGCLETFYNPYYLVGNCFTEDELLVLSEIELSNLLRLSTFATEAFY